MADTEQRRTRHDSREDLAGEHPLTDIGQLVLAVLFFGIWVADSVFLHWTTLGNAYVPVAVRLPIGIVLVALSGYMAWASHRIIFGERRQDPHVVRKGVFAVVRHPMYLSEILLYLGLLLFNMSLAACGVWLLVIAFLHYIARKEERLLLARFGEEYAQYMRDVAMWFPLRFR